MSALLSRLFLGVFASLSIWPLGLLAALGRGLGALLWVCGASRRRVALKNLALCFPDWSETERRRVAREHFGWVGRSIVERALLWHAAPERIRRLIQVKGDVGLAERADRPVMWLVLHFTGLEVAGAACQLFQSRHGVDIYQPQSNPVFDAALKKGRMRFGQGECHPRQASIRPVLKRIKEGWAFFNMPDMDFGAKDAIFAPFFGVPAATLLAPSRMAKALNMLVQPVVVTTLPGGQGWQVHYMDPLPGFPSEDAEADTRWLNTWIEARVREQPAQYLWVHRRFKTRPEGQAPLYDD